jgi:uncharacterized protein YbjT (DUF2867 family)
MKLAVLGATGGTGQAIVAQALDAGHEVTVLVRRPEALLVGGDRLTVLVGDARDPDAIRAVVAGQDAVICSLGLPASGDTRTEVSNDEKVDVCRVSTELLLVAMPGAGVKRLVLMSTHGAGTSNDGSPYVVWLRDLVGERVKDKDDMEALVMATEAPVDWTVIRNPRIYEGPKGQPYDVYTQIELDRTSRITYGDLADFAISEATNPKHVGELLTITEPMGADPAS